MSVEETLSIEEAVEAVPAILRARQRGINHLRAMIAAWDEMGETEKREAVERALDRLENPW